MSQAHSIPALSPLAQDSGDGSPFRTVAASSALPGFSSLLTRRTSPGLRSGAFYSHPRMLRAIRDGGSVSPTVQTTLASKREAFAASNTPGGLDCLSHGAALSTRTVATTHHGDCNEAS